jgi:hypothetical protein|tara:strand:- start:38 stop:229 length:192 start_codon:yes stop_codon:yes gene_type:complete
MRNQKKDKNDAWFWHEWHRMNGRYKDRYTKAHERLKDMCGYNYDSEFNDEIDLKAEYIKFKNK